ncbi:DinB family protein [Spirosoma oryzae]|uniref:DinB family protein n=1 Tax=Spirosoma oryzae TaxID=1469603 RepID=A0A2T0S126_9BACT|nr:hypothetical protein [Spirosoma oryzae]PRY27003.1 DinB family protein [Spirosoma oryzae]
MNVLDKLERYIDEVPRQLMALSEDQLTEHLPEKWSRKQILGHLIDSALHNLKRFTEAQFAGQLYQVQGYNQNQLVIANTYQTLPLDHLLGLWSSLNRQIVYVTKAMSLQLRNQPIRVGEVDAPTQTLACLVNDYVLHMEHHFRTLI